MPFINKNNLRIYQFDSFLAHGIVHGVFTRHGGVSPEPWDTLNVGSLVGDDRRNVENNRQRSVAALDRNPESLYEVWQVHGNNVVVTDQPRDPSVAHIQADAIVTPSPSVTIFMRFADCVPILLYDPVNRVCAMVHAGWKGTTNRVVVHTVDRMKGAFGSDPKKIIAGIGPSIGPEKYEVGENVADEVKTVFDTDRHAVLTSVNGSVHLDLWGANQVLLQQCGVESIEIAGICTATHVEDWYSHRAENGKTGRFGALIGLE